MKLLFQVVTIILVSSVSCRAQRFWSVVFEKLPQSYQLYPRDQNNEANIPISGVVETADWKYASVQVLRDGQPFKYLKSDITYKNGIGAFAMETKIKAELAGYDFRVFLSKTTDSTLVVERKDVVSGDVYVLSGQSNSTGFFTEDDTSRFCRTFGRLTDILNTAPYNPADTLWSYSNLEKQWNNVGTMGFEIQKQLSRISGVPNCLINAGFHWSTAFQHAIRNESNPADLNTGYGRMLYRLQKGGLTDAVKAYIFRQGESEAYHEGFDWPTHFGKLHGFLKQDLPNLAKFYVFQIDIIFYESPIGAELRDYQRRLPDIYPDVVSIASVGTQGFDGLHYAEVGNVQSGTEVSRLIARDFYEGENTPDIASPSVQKVFYTDKTHKQLILSFDDEQQLIYPDPYQPTDKITLNLKDFFYLDHYDGRVASGKAEGNRVILDLQGVQNASFIDYLPMFVKASDPIHPYTGPYIKNNGGMRAFTFYQVPISEGLATPSLAADVKENGAVILKWNAVEGASGYVLERKLSGETSFKIIARTDSRVMESTDTPPVASGKMAYRIRAVSEKAESAGYGVAEAEIVEEPVVLSAGPGSEILSVFPNPVLKDQPLNVRFGKKSNGNISVFHVGGTHLYEERIVEKAEVVIDFTGRSPGLYLLEFKSGNHTFTKKLVVR